MTRTEVGIEAYAAERLVMRRLIGKTVMPEIDGSEFETLHADGAAWRSDAHAKR